MVLKVRVEKVGRVEKIEGVLRSSICRMDWIVIPWGLIIRGLDDVGRRDWE